MHAAVTAKAGNDEWVFITRMVRDNLAIYGKVNWNHASSHERVMRDLSLPEALGCKGGLLAQEAAEGW
jgi:hypothetical protein